MLCDCIEDALFRRQDTTSFTDNYPSTAQYTNDLIIGLF